MKQLVYENQQCPETIEELPQRVEVAAATARVTTGVFIRIRANMLRRVEACITSQGQDVQHLKGSIVALIFVPMNNVELCVARTKHPSE